MARILIVDDAAFMRGSLKFILETSGHEVVGMAKNGKEAFEKFKELKPDLVTLDILMKDVDGITALKNIKEFDPSAKVVMLTALGQEEKKAEADIYGANGYIRKPFKQAEIAEELNKIIGK